MGKEMYQVQIGEEVRQYEAGTTYGQIAADYQKNYEEDIVLVFVNGKLQELFKKLKSDCTIQFETTAGEIGNKTYRRSINLMLVKAVYDVAGHDAVRKVRIHFSVSKGYYCTVDGDINVDQDFLDRVEARMHEMVDISKIMVLVTHSMASAVEMCNRCIWMERGRIIADGVPCEITEKYLKDIRE